MTLPYSVTKIGMRNQIADLYRVDLDKYKFLDKNNNDIYQNQRLINKLSEIIYNTVLTKFPKLKEQENYLKDMVSLGLKYRIPIKWRSPSGLHIAPEYLVVNKEQISYIVGKLHRFTHLSRIPNKIDKRKMINSIVPNFIHSLDAAHVNAVINSMKDKGLPILTIHDCFGTHPNHIDMLNKVVREEFIKLYPDNKDYLEQFHDNYTNLLQQQLNKNKNKLSNNKLSNNNNTPNNTPNIPKLPDKGSLNLKSVLKSHYFII